MKFFYITCNQSIKNQTAIDSLTSKMFFFLNRRNENEQLKVKHFLYEQFFTSCQPQRNLNPLPYDSEFNASPLSNPQVRTLLFSFSQAEK